MEVVAARCAGLDVHKATIVACALIAQEGRARPRKEYATFPTTAAGLASLAAWLKGLGVEQVGMEATGVYWRPVYAVLEAQGGFELIGANAQAHQDGAGAQDRHQGCRVAGHAGAPRPDAQKLHPGPALS